MGYSSLPGGEVRIQLSGEDYNRLLFTLGYATGAAFKEKNKQAAEMMIELTNSINIGNPAYRPYSRPGTANRSIPRGWATPRKISLDD